MQQAKLFEEFSQADATTAQCFGGKALPSPAARAHDGRRRDCDQRARQGLVFTVRLPAGAVVVFAQYPTWVRKPGKGTFDQSARI